VASLLRRCPSANSALLLRCPTGAGLVQRCPETRWCLGYGGFGSATSQKSYTRTEHYVETQSCHTRWDHVYLPAYPNPWSLYADPEQAFVLHYFPNPDFSLACHVRALLNYAPAQVPLPGCPLVDANEACFRTPSGAWLRYEAARPNAAYAPVMITRRPQLGQTQFLYACDLYLYANAAELAPIPPWGTCGTFVTIDCCTGAITYGGLIPPEACLAGQFPCKVIIAENTPAAKFAAIYASLLYMGNLRFTVTLDYYIPDAIWDTGSISGAQIYAWCQAYETQCRMQVTGSEYVHEGWWNDDWYGWLKHTVPDLDVIIPRSSSSPTYWTQHSVETAQSQAFTPYCGPPPHPPACPDCVNAQDYVPGGTTTGQATNVNVGYSFGLSGATPYATCPYIAD